MNVLITGATKGIGRAIAERMAMEGGEILAIARTTKKLEELVDRLSSHYPQSKVHVQSADLADKNSIEQITREVTRLFPKLDLLINNAGLYREGALLQEPDGQLEDLLAVNLLAPYRLTRALLPRMQGSGHVINICSVASRDIHPNQGSYAISKHALLAFNRALRQELLDTAIKVTAILPGPTWTSSWEGAPIPPERLMPPEAVAEAVWQACQAGPRTVVEEVVLRPQRGDL